MLLAFLVSLLGSVSRVALNVTAQAEHLLDRVVPTMLLVPKAMS